MKRISAAILAAAVYLGSLPILPLSALAIVPLAGCTSAQAKSFADAFIASATAVVDADPTASYVPDLQLAIDSMKTAEAGWNGSSINCALTSAANTAVKILDSIVPSSPVALIATVAVAGFDALEAALFPCSTPALTARAFGGPRASLRASSRAYPAYKSTVAHAWFPEHAYRKQFNQAAKDSGLTVRI